MSESSGFMLDFDIKGGDFSSAGTASSKIKNALKKIGIAPAIIKRVAVATYEAEINVVAHAYEGKLSAEIFSTKILILVEDNGPGIPDVEKAMTAGFSTASPQVREMGFGAGMGLPNIKRCCDDMQIETEVGVGTKLHLQINF